jgi:hypothetical protein
LADADSCRPAVAVLLQEFARRVQGIEVGQQTTLDCTPRICVRLMLDILARRERDGCYDERDAIRAAFAELIPFEAR